MSNVLGKLAENIGVFVQKGGILKIENFNFKNQQQLSRPRSEQILIERVKTEVYSRLNQSIHSQFINIEKESQPRLVNRPWDAEIKVGLKDSVPLSKESTVLDFFNREDVGGRFLILGNPGSGKTTSQLILAKSLLEGNVDSDLKYPIPVLLNLFSWKASE